MKTRKKILGAILATIACFSLSPGVQAAPQVAPPPDGCYPNFTTAEGCNALSGLTTGAGNTGVGWFALAFAGASNFNTGIGGGALVLNTGDSNTAVGAAAGLLNTSGGLNTAVGTDAMVFNDTGGSNTAVGAFALEDNVSGVTNAALGTFAAQNTTGSFNVAVGGFAFRANTSGNRNTAAGAGALEDITGGDDNTAIGELAGINYSGTESNNICIGSATHGTAGESNAIRIGDASSSGGIDVINNGSAANLVSIGGALNSQGINVLQTLLGSSITIGNGLSTVATASSCFVGGIYNQAFGPADMAVRIGSDNKLGTVVSSRRFKHDIKPMDNSSEAILALKPVTFQYNSDNTHTPRIGLIAEDVAQVSPGLVIADKEGKPLSVRYEDVNVMLLNEFVKEHKKVEGLQVIVAQQQKGMEVLAAQLKEQAAQIQKVSAQLEVSKPAAQVVVNKP